MAESTLTLSTDASELTELLAKLSAKQKVVKSEAFAERFQFLLDADKILSPGVVKKSDSATATGELLVPLNPSDALLGLSSAFLAGNGDFSVFDHEHSFSVNPKTQHSRGDNS